MKNVLFASTALVAFAGAAQADILITGNAEMGIFSSDVDGADGGTDGNTEFFTDIDVTFTMTGETDGGLLFGASIDIDEGVGDATGNDKEDGGIAIFLSGAFGTVTLGDTDGAMDWALGEVSFNGGSLADNETVHGGYNGNYLDGEYDGQIARYDYSFGDFGFAISAELDDDDEVLGDGSDDLGTGYALGVRYSLDLGGTTVNLGLGYQTVDNDISVVMDSENDGVTLGETGFVVGGTEGGDVDAIGVSANATLANGLTLGIAYTEFDVEGAGDVDHIGVGVGYSMGAISLSANYGEFDQAGGLEQDGFGLSAGYDLGGGAIVQLGYSTTDTGVAGEDDIDAVSFGIRMNF